MNVHIALDGVDDIDLGFVDEDEELSETEEGVGEDGEEEVVNPVIPTGWEMVWAAVFFGLLWALMKYVLLPPILNARQEREDKITSDREAADRARQSVGEVQNDYENALLAARAEADGIIDAAREEAGEHRSEVMGSATDQISSLRADAAAAGDTSRVQALDALRPDVAEIAVQAASAVLGKPVDPQSAQRAIDQTLRGGPES